MSEHDIPVGPHLDRAVAAALGWRQEPPFGWWVAPSRSVVSVRDDPPAVSTDLTAAWRVTDDLTMRTTQWMRIEQCSVYTEVTFEQIGAGEADYCVSARAETVVEAICRAALLVPVIHEA